MPRMLNLGLESLVNPLLVAKRRVVRATMASSYDRRGGNHDWSSYIRREGRAAVMMDSEGPGVVTRIWTADPQRGTLRIFLDRDPKPAIETPFAKLFDILPLSQGIGGESKENYARSAAEHLPMGYTSYCPIPFQRHCRITIEPEDDYLYYHVNAHLFPPGTGVESFRAESEVSTELVRAAGTVLKNWQSGKPLVDMGRPTSQEFEVRPGEERVLFRHEGAGVIRGLRLRVQSDSRREAEQEYIRDNVWLAGHFDDDEPKDASVRAPIGPMFLDFGQTPQPRSLFAGKDPAGEYYCFFPMPHRKLAELKLVNRTILPLKFSATVLHEPSAEIEDDLYRFRVKWHSETPFGPDHRDYEGLACRLLNLGGEENYEMLYIHGAGHFVGCGFHVDLREAPTDRAAGEGDEMFFVDDDPRLTMNGTGTEDYLNDAWGIRGYVGPLSGDAVAGIEGTSRQIFGYRLHIPDPIPFLRKGRFTLEHGTGNNCSGLYRSTAYWYMDPTYARIRDEEWRWEELRTGKRQANQEE